MALPTLFDRLDLADFPGAPFPEAVIKAAESSIRRDAGWHIAPVVRETIEVDADPSGVVSLPTLRVVRVHSISGADGAALTGWTVTRAGRLSGCRGRGTLTVDLEHGYENVDDLLPVVAARCKRQLTDATLSARSEGTGTRNTSETYDSGRYDSRLTAAGVRHYQLPVVA